jgi:hypothetical protein
LMHDHMESARQHTLRLFGTIAPSLLLRRDEGL